MKSMIKNIPPASAVCFADQVDYLPGQVVSKTLSQNSAVSITVFAFDKDEEISTHASHGDALVLVLDGVGTFTIDETAHTVHSGEAILMPAEKPHAVFATERMKMLLTVVFPPKDEQA